MVNGEWREQEKLCNKIKYGMTFGFMMTVTVQKD